MNEEYKAAAYHHYNSYHHRWLAQESYLSAAAAAQAREIPLPKAGPVNHPLKIELSVVQSPKVFGMETLNQLTTTSIEKDERMIERHVAEPMFASPAIGPAKPAPSPVTAPVLAPQEPAGRPRRPLSAPLEGSPKKGAVPEFLSAKKDKAKMAELASPIKITTGNLMMGLNPLFSLPPISPLKSPTQPTSKPINDSSDAKEQSVVMTTAQSIIASEAYARKRAGSFTSELVITNQPLKKRFQYGNDTEGGGKEGEAPLIIAEPDKYPKNLAASLFGSGNNQRSLSVETVAAYDQMNTKPKTDQSMTQSVQETESRQTTIPKSYAPEFDLVNNMGSSPHPHPGPMLNRTPYHGGGRAIGAVGFDPYGSHMRPPPYGSPYSSVLGPAAASYGAAGHHSTLHRHMPPHRMPNPTVMPYSRGPHPRVSASAVRPPMPTAVATNGGSKSNSGTGSASLQHSIIQEIRSLPQGESFQVAMATWQWYNIDGVDLPCVLRNGESYVAVHMVQMKLLAKFPPNVPQELMRKHRMVSYKMSVLESWVLNTVNAVHCKFEYGYQLFSPADDLVRGADVRKFYFSVKIYNYDRIVDVYRHEISAISELHVSLTAHVSSLKACAEEELQNLTTREASQEHRTTSSYMTSLPKDPNDSSQIYRLPVAPAPQAPPPPAVTVAKSPATHHPYINGQSEMGRASAKLDRLLPPSPHYSGLPPHERTMMTHHPAAFYQNSLRSAVQGQRGGATMMRPAPYSLPIHNPLNMMTAPSVASHHEQAPPPMHRMLPPSSLAGYHQAAQHHHLMQHPANGHPY